MSVRVRARVRQPAGADRVGGGGDLAVEGEHQAAVGLHAADHARLDLVASLDLHVGRVEAGHERCDQLALVRVRGPLVRLGLGLG